MEQEVRFRAYHKKTGKMLKPLTLKEIYNIGWYDDDTIQMQSTGLYDKNGNEVFRGDLLKTNDRIVEVVWHKQCGGWDTNLVKYIGKRKSNGLDNAEWQFRAKIIGNIYENSELLD